VPIPGLFFLGCVIAGLYGALHDQISYSISPEYYTQFKFYQFNVPPQLHNRLGAAAVGWRATWWMGILIGAFVIPTGLIVRREWKDCFSLTLKSFVIVTLTAFVIGFGALGISFFTIHAGAIPSWACSDDVVDKVNFARVGTMHNFSYLGGLIGIATGIAYLIIKRKSKQ